MVKSDSEMLKQIERLLSRNHYCVLATSSRDGRPQSTGAVYCSRGLDLYIYTDPQSKKARNIRRNPNVAVTVPVWERRPFWVPPRSIQFRGLAEILPAEDTIANQVYEFRVLFIKVSITDTKGCFVHVRPTRRISTYGVGVPRMTMARHPEEADRSTPIPEESVTPK
jgi:nitroimidazol reductase NimA-like FMN-containing flavoprotein (pyridoxamine 5'-phosphate oxidase superfamily)